MQISQSRAANRGPLIAVIKIQLSADNIDRVFLHQNDNDYRLAEEFQQKHNLSPTLINHIFQRIKLSRQSLQQDFSQREPRSSHHRQISEKASEKADKAQFQNFQPLFKNQTKKLSNFDVQNFEESKQKSFQPKQQKSSESHNGTYLSKDWIDLLNLQKQKFNKVQKQIENDPHNGNFKKIEETSENYGYSKYSFQDEDKPSRVKVIRRDDSSKRSSSMRKSHSKAEISRINKNVTNRLYNQTQIKQNYLKRIKEKAKTDQEQKQLKQATHKPKINHISKVIAEGRYQNVDMYNYLVGAVKRTESRLENQRAKNEEKQLQNCSFKPQLNPISRKLTNNRSHKLIESNILNSKCTKNHGGDQSFRPELNKISREIVKDKGNFQERMKSYLEQKNMKLDEKNRQKHEKERIDNTGQKLFKPRILSKRQPKGQQIYDYLYQLNKQSRKAQPEEKKPKINEHSDHLVKQIHKKRMAWLFSELDSDQDGYISPKRINIETINEDILEIIMPVLFEMEEMNIELNLVDFSKAIQNLHLSLNCNQKNILYNYSNTLNSDKNN